MEEEHADDATKLGSSMSSCLPLLVFQHRYHGQEDDDEDVDNEMLMFSISQQSLHKNMGAWPSSRRQQQHVLDNATRLDTPDPRPGP